MNNERVSDLLSQALQTEQDGARIYETAIRCVSAARARAARRESL